MANKYGAMEIPVLAPVGSEAVTDPALKPLGQFIAAVMTSSLGDAWSAVSSEPIVKNVICHNPEKVNVSITDHPALYVWRSKAVPTRLTDGIRQTVSTVSALWLLAPETQEVASIQAPFFNGVQKVLDEALPRGREPSWLLDGDTDPEAPERGTLIWRIVEAEYLGLSRVEEETIAIEFFEGGEIRPADGYLFGLDIRETFQRSPQNYAPSRSGYASGPSKVTATITPANSAEPVLAVEVPPTA